MMSGDRLDDTLFGTSPGSMPSTVVDWQTVPIGMGPTDAAYLYGAGVEMSDGAVWDGYLLDLG